jgi:hypothetical protein
MIPALGSAPVILSRELRLRRDGCTGGGGYECMKGDFVWIVELAGSRLMSEWFPNIPPMFIHSNGQQSMGWLTCSLEGCTDVWRSGKFRRSRTAAAKLYKEPLVFGNLPPKESTESVSNSGRCKLDDPKTMARGSVARGGCDVYQSSASN